MKILVVVAVHVSIPSKPFYCEMRQKPTQVEIPLARPGQFQLNRKMAYIWPGAYIGGKIVEMMVFDNQIALMAKI